MSERPDFPEVPFPLLPEGPGADRWSVEGGALTLESGPRTDLFVDPAGPPGGGDSGVGDGRVLPDAPRLVGVPPEGDFQLAARVTVDFRSTFDAGVLLVHAGERTWAKLCFEYTPQGRPSVVSVVTRGESDDANAFEVAENRILLRVTRHGSAYAFHASEDGKWWRLVRYFGLGENAGDGPVRIGFLSQSPTGEGCTAVFDGVRFAAEAPEDLRDGS